MHPRVELTTVTTTESGVGTGGRAPAGDKGGVVVARGEEEGVVGVFGIRGDMVGDMVGDVVGDVGVVT